MEKLILLFLSILAVGSSAQATNTSTDAAALRAFVSAVGSGATVLSSSWAGGDPCRNWAGVSCLRNRVIRLSLPSFNLSGTIPPEIGNLSFLLRLDLSSNRLSGEIPAELGRLHNLRFLNLTGNSLGGPIPPSLFRLRNLELLGIAENLLSGELPGDTLLLLLLPKLTRVYLNNNQLSGKIPAAFGGLAALVDLDLAHNSLTGEIPPELGNLTRLEYLSLAENALEGSIPPQLGNISTLQILYIFATNVSGEVPAELGKLQNLQYLMLYDNFLTGPFPAAVYNMSALVSFDISINEAMSGELPPDFGNRLPPLLQDLYINANHFSGEIPASLGNASMLQNLELSYNYFHGRVPEELGQLQNLVLFSVSDNLELSGDIGFLNSLSRCPSLTDVNLRNNQFTGALSAAAIANLSGLTRLVVERNLIEGPIPSTFNLTPMITLVLSYNKFSGPIPPALAAMPSLERLFLEVNRVEGPLPSEFGFATTLGLLYLQVNNISGPIPDSIGNLTRMRNLNMAENKLETAIPPRIWRLTELFELNLSHNHLQGSLPAAMASLGVLAQLDLSSNQLSGMVPRAVTKMNTLQFLSLAKNNFSGEIPPEIGAIVNLRDLDLSSNSFSGSVPQSMAKIRDLKSLNLSFNNLQGKLPGEGIFSRVSPGISTDSFLGNPGLCGAPWFNLPPCGKPAKNTHRGFLAGLIAGGAIAIIAVFLAVLFILIRKKIKNRKMNTEGGGEGEEEEEIKGAHPLISRHELATATGGFSEENLIGSGSFGRVYRGELADGTAVAVKVLDVEMGEGAWKSFETECRVLREARHRNLVSAITTCSNLDFRAIVLPFMENGSLDRWLGGSERLGLRRRIAIAEEVAKALEYLHHGCSAPILHCDVKPSNVLLDSAMAAHLADFGIAKMVAEEGISASRTSAQGTFGYMPPEYGMALRVTSKGDVYSYGILLLEIITGVSPTDRRFAGGEMNLRQWVDEELQRGVEGVVDAQLLEEEEEEEEDGETSESRGHYLTTISRHDCLSAVIELGLWCSAESPKERPDMTDVAAMMKKIRNDLKIAT
ncbi:uncharacterized protein LOC144710020 [Wolffia australiana]